MAPAQVQTDSTFGQGHLAGLGHHGLQEFGVQHVQAAATENRQGAVRGHTRHGFFVIEVIAKLGDVGRVLVFAGQEAALEQAFLPQPLAQLLDQDRVFGPALGKQVAHAVEHGQGVRKVGADFAVVQHLGRLHKGRGFLHGVERGVGPEAVGQGLEPSFARHHALGAALLFEGQVQVFQGLFGLGQGNGLAQRGREFALLVDGFDHRGAAVFELTQIRQAGLQFSQLNVVQPTRGLFAVTRNEGHGSTTIEEFDGSLHLLGTDADFSGQLGQYGLHVTGQFKNREAGILPQSTQGLRPNAGLSRRDQPAIAARV